MGRGRVDHVSSRWVGAMGEAAPWYSWLGPVGEACVIMEI